MTNPCGLLLLVFAAIQQRGRGPALLALKKPMRPSSAASSWPLAARAEEAPGCCWRPCCYPAALSSISRPIAACAEDSHASIAPKTPMRPSSAVLSRPLAARALPVVVPSSITSLPYNNGSEGKLDILRSESMVRYSGRTATSRSVAALPDTNHVHASV